MERLIQLSQDFWYSYLPLCLHHRRKILEIGSTKNASKFILVMDYGKDLMVKLMYVKKLAFLFHCAMHILCSLGKLNFVGISNQQSNHKRTSKTKQKVEINLCLLTINKPSKLVAMLPDSQSFDFKFSHQGNKRSTINFL